MSQRAGHSGQKVGAAGGQPLPLPWTPGRKSEVTGREVCSFVQVCWEKFCEYWDVEGRYVPVTKDYPVGLRQNPKAGPSKLVLFLPNSLPSLRLHQTCQVQD